MSLGKSNPRSDKNHRLFIKAQLNTRNALVELGLDEQAVIFIASRVALPKGQTWADLWSAEALKTSYETAIRAMARSAKTIETLEPAEAARDTLLVGQSVIRLINFDPLLPDEFIDRSHFKRLIDEMKSYNALGVKAWKAFYASNENAKQSTPPT